MDVNNQTGQRLKLLSIDPWLEPYKDKLLQRRNYFNKRKKEVLDGARNLSLVSNGHLFFGFHFTKDGVYYREWAPGADAIFLMGDFNQWNETSHPLKSIGNGVWEIFIPADTPVPHLSLVKIIIWNGDRKLYRTPLYVKRTFQDPNTLDFAGQIWNPEKKFRWSDKDFKVNKRQSLFIYEAHVGMAQEKEDIGSFQEFTDNILKRIHSLGYNCIQLMAIMNHPYYASFGYHVSNFFAVSSWFGTPDDLKYLINKAHGMGIAVIMDLVHSHAVKNTVEGINEFDGTDYQFFHEGNRGNHVAWDSKVFNYSKPEVIHFLLSNIKYWLEEYHLDGFRFDGVTSMLYDHHGLGLHFDNYDKYFDNHVDMDAVAYLQLANTLIHEINPGAISVAEDMSGMPGLCIPVSSGGLGFDYRLAMGIPDFWIRLLDTPDEQWNMETIWHELTSKRPQESRIAYVESHDQALVGDKTIIFRLADKEMYWHMAKEDDSYIIDRAIALHKMFRFITLTLGGEAYLNFMGNEFGHPEWIDFPREGNQWSFKYSRRQWSLADNPELQYEYLQNFDREMLAFAQRKRILKISDVKELWLDNHKKIIIYRKNDLIFVYNFNSTDSFADFVFPTHDHGDYRLVFSSDDGQFGGYDRVSKDEIYPTKELQQLDCMRGIEIYTPARTVLVFERKE